MVELEPDRQHAVRCIRLRLTHLVTYSLLERGISSFTWRCCETRNGTGDLRLRGSASWPGNKIVAFAAREHERAK